MTIRFSVLNHVLYEGGETAIGLGQLARALDSHTVHHLHRQASKSVLGIVV